MAHRYMHVCLGLKKQYKYKLVNKNISQIFWLDIGMNGEKEEKQVWDAIYLCNPYPAYDYMEGRGVI